MVWLLVGIVLVFALLLAAFGVTRVRAVYRGPSVSITSSHERQEGILEATVDKERLVLFLRLVNERRGTLFLDDVELLTDVQLEPIAGDDSPVEYVGRDSPEGDGADAIAEAGSDPASDRTELSRYVYRRRDSKLGRTFHAFDMHFQPVNEPFELTVRVRPEIPSKALLVPWHEDRFELEPVERTFEVRPN